MFMLILRYAECFSGKPNVGSRCMLLLLQVFDNVVCKAPSQPASHQRGYMGGLCYHYSYDLDPSSLYVGLLLRVNETNETGSILG